MQKLIHYLRENWKWIILSVILSQAFAFLIIPYILSKAWFKAVLTLPLSSPSLFLLAGVSLLLLFFAYKPAFTFWVRYKNNAKLKEIPFTYMDGIFLFLVSSMLAIFIAPLWTLGDILLSIGIKVWLITLSISFIIFSAMIIYKGWSYRLAVPSQDKVKTNPDFFQDEPITHEDEDLLDRKQFIEGLYNQIVNYPLATSFVFGLFGKWGEGKTSALNLLKNKLYRNDNLIVFEYDPWYFSSTEDLIKSFYEGLYPSLNRYFFLPNLRRLLGRYQKLISSGLKLTGINIEVGLRGESLHDLREKIEYWISIIGKKIVILIDDIDRLQDKSEIQEVFKLVKLSAKFKNTVFVLSFDPEIVKSGLKDESTADSAFLDKIVQAPIHLSAIDQSHIDRYLYYSYPNEGHFSGIDRLFQKLEIDQNRIRDFERDFNHLYESQIKRLFPTLRHVKRYLNALYQTLPSVKNEVHLQDFLILELIRVFYAEVYQDIWLRPWYYIPSWGVKLWISSPFGVSPGASEKYQKIKEHISHLLQNQPEREVLQELLETIFFVEVKNAFAQSGRTGHDNMASAYRSEKRITHPDVFPKYFMLKVPISDLPDETVEALISTWNNLDPTQLEPRIIDDLKRFQQEKQLIRLLEKLIVFLQGVMPNTARTIITAFYKNIDVFSKEGKQVGQSEYDKSYSLMLWLINDKIDRSQIEPLLIRIIKETPSFDFAVRTVLSCRRERGGSLFNIYDNITIENLHRTLSERLSQHFISGLRDIFAEEPESYGFILYQWGAYNQEDKQKVNQYVFGLVDNNPQYLGEIIKRFILNWGEPRGEEIEYDRLLKLYDENRLYEKIRENYSNSYSNQDEKSAIDLFIEVYEGQNTAALAKVKQEANKQRFLDVNNKGYEYFRNRNFPAALEQFNQALKITDWQDDYNWIDDVKFMKWKCLLELALNYYNDGQPNREFFEEACNLAGNEARIKKLVDMAYKDGHPDIAPIEEYYCIFYYLQWYFTGEDQKAASAEAFKIHYSIATGSNASGRSDEITKRCNDLLGRINSVESSGKM